MATGRGVLLMAAMFAAAGFGPAGAAERREVGALILDGVPETPPETAAAIARYQNARAAVARGYAADGGGLYVATRFGETTQAHFVATPGGARRQLTYFDEPLRTIVPSPTDPNVFAFLRDNGGDENFQLYVFDRATGDERLVSDGAGRKSAPVWSRDGARLAWQATRADGRHAVIVASLDEPAARAAVFEGDGWWAPTDWSDDGARLLLLRYASINEADVHVLDLASGETLQVRPSTKKIAYGDAVFGPEGDTVYYTSDEYGEFLDLVRHHLPSGERMVLSNDVDWDVSEFAIAPDGKTYAFFANEAGRTTMRVRRLRGDRPVPAPDLPAGVASDLSFSPDGERIAFTLNGATSPGDVYVWDWRAARGGDDGLARWTESEVGGLSTEDFVAPTFFDYPTFDAVQTPEGQAPDGQTPEESPLEGSTPRRIPAFVYKPAGPGPHPVVVSIHGGPESQARPTFSATIQHWVRELGVAVIRPNVRGSRGFGKTYLTLDNGVLREDAVRDVGALLDWIAAEDDLDASRVMVAGGSYGGYMVLAAMAAYGDRLAGGAESVGISNFVSFLENTSDYRRDLRRAEYGDEREPEMRAFLEQISPLTRADDIDKPLLIVQGLNDPRVPASESDQILKAGRANGVEAWYMAARDEGHGFRKKSNVDAQREAYALFIEKIIGRKDEAVPETPSQEPRSADASAAGE
ncbi:MAG: S9 family peptidase [Parvularculaceae bacterium]